MNQQFNINFLRYFYSAGKHRSISKAARENFVTQSAISQGINKLEIELGKKLLSNKKNRFEITAEGQLLLDHCEKIFSIFSYIDDLFNEQEGVYQGKFTLATSHSLAISFLPPHLKRLLSLHPRVEPILQLGHSGLVREWVLKNEADFGIILAKESDAKAFNTCPIFHGAYGFYQSSRKTALSLERLIISEESHEDLLLIDRLKQQTKIIPPILAVHSWEVIANLIQEGLGFGILPDYVAREHHLTPINTEIPQILYSIIGIWSKNKELPRNNKMFIELFRH